MASRCSVETERRKKRKEIDELFLLREGHAQSFFQRRRRSIQHAFMDPFKTSIDCDPVPEGLPAHPHPEVQKGFVSPKGLARSGLPVSVIKYYVVEGLESPA